MIRRILLPLAVLLTVFTAPSVHAQIFAGTYFTSLPEPLPSCIPGSPGVQMPVIWDTTTSSFKFCSGVNIWSTWPGGGGGSPAVGTINQVQKTNGSGVFQAGKATDNGTVFATNEDLDSAGPNPSFDLRDFGGYSSATTTPPATTGSITSGSSSLSLVSAQDFANGQGIVVYQAGTTAASQGVSTPGTPTVTPAYLSGGATTYTYQVVAEARNGALTAASATGTTTTGAATLGLNTVTLTQCSRTSNVTTYTSSGTHHIVAGSQIDIEGFGGNDICNGVKTVLTTPLSTTFTVSDGIASNTVNTSGTPTAKVVACNTLTYASGSYSGQPTLRYWIYRNNALAGVAQGQDPWFQDCGQAAPNAPAYVPSSPPSSPQNGYLATTITAGGGTTTLTLATAASNTVSSQPVLHDNSMPLKNAVQAALNASGGTVYIPNAGSTNLFVFNSTLDMTTGLVNLCCAVRIHLNSFAYLNQPWIPHANFDLEGEPRNGQTFQYVNNSSIAGNAYPLILITEFSGTPLHIKLLQFGCAQAGQSCILADEGADGGGATGIVMEDVSVVGSITSKPVVWKGGFDFYWLRGSGQNLEASFSGGYILTMTNASTAVTGATPGQLPGRIYVQNVDVVGGSFELNCLPNSLTTAATDFTFGPSIDESVVTPYFHFNCHTGVSGNLNFVDVDQADDISGTGTPLIDAANGGLASVTVTGGFAFNATSPVFIGGGSSTLLTTNSPFANPGNVASYLSLNPGNVATNNIVNATGTNGAVQYAMQQTVAPGVAVSAGGSVPIGAIPYQVQFLDVNGNAGPPSPVAIATTTTGNQTVTITIPIPPAGAISWFPYRSSARVELAICSTPIPVATTTFIDSISFPCGNSFSPATGAASSLNANGIQTPSLLLSNSGFTGLFNFPTPLTANQTYSLPNTSGTFFLTPTNALTLSGTGSGSAQIQVAAAAGTPNPLQLPTSTGTSGQALITDGGNPQHLSWATIGGGGGSGTVASGTVGQPAIYTATGTVVGSSALFLDTKQFASVQAAMTAAGASEPAWASSGGPSDIPNGSRIGGGGGNILFPAISSQSGGAHSQDFRFSGFADAMFSPGYDNIGNLQFAREYITHYVTSPLSSVSANNVYAAAWQTNFLNNTQNVNENGYTNKTNIGSLYVQNNSWSKAQVIGSSFLTNCYGNGDCVGLNGGASDFGGSDAGSDEGMHPISVSASQGWIEYSGTISGSPGTGATSIAIAPTQGGGTQGQGRFLIDVTKATNTGTISSISGTGFVTVTGSATSWPTASTTTTTSAAITVTGSNLTPGSVNILVASSAGFSNGNAICVADTAAFEYTKITNIPDGTHITAIFAVPHSSGATIATGGLCGFGMEFTDDRWTAAGGIGFVVVTPPLRQVWPVVSNSSATSAVIWLSIASTGDNYGGNAATPGASYFIYPMSQITDVTNGGPGLSNTLTISPNNVAWGSGDTVSIPLYPAFKGQFSNTQYNKFFYSQGAAGFSNGYAFNGVYNGNDQFFSISNGTNANLYNVNGLTGRLVPPQSFFSTTGVARVGLQLGTAPSSAALSIGCPPNGCAALRRTTVFTITSSGGNDFLGYDSGNASFQLSTGSSANLFSFDQFGILTMPNGSFSALKFPGATSGAVSIDVQAAAGTYNFNLPTTAGAAGQLLTSQAGGSTAMTWTTPGTGTVATTGSPASGNLTKFSGALTITNGDLSGDVTTAGTLVATVAKINGTSIPTNSAADQAIVTTASATGSWTSLPNCTDSSGNHINYATSTHAFSCGSTSSSSLSGLTTGVVPQATSATAISNSNPQLDNGVTTSNTLTYAGTGGVSAPKLTATGGTGQISFANLLFSGTAPTISSGFGTSPSVTANNGVVTFRLNVGTGGSASSGAIGMPTASVGWNCSVQNLTAHAGNRADDSVQTASTTTTVSVQNQTKSTGAAVAWTASDILTASCIAF